MMAELVEEVDTASAEQPRRFQKLQFSAMEGTWRALYLKGHRITGTGNLLAYLSPSAAERFSRPARKRVMDRDDLQLLITMPSGG
jgi:hypothetical protein